MTTHEIPGHDWGEYLSLISESLGPVTTFVWVEDASGRCWSVARALPLAGLALTRKGHHASTIEVLLGGVEGLSQAIAHLIEGPLRLWVSVSDHHLLDGILVEDRAEQRTLVRFDMAPRKASVERHHAFVSRLPGRRI